MRNEESLFNSRLYKLKHLFCSEYDPCMCCVEVWARHAASGGQLLDCAAVSAGFFTVHGGQVLPLHRLHALLDVRVSVALDDHSRLKALNPEVYQV